MNGRPLHLQPVNFQPMDFQHFSPTRIVFGRGSLRCLGPSARTLGGRALLVTGRHFARRSGVLARALAELDRHGVDARAFDGISANPRSDEVDAAIRAARDARCDLIVGLGGGSALDAAKAVAVGLYVDDVGALVGVTLPAHASALPVIAIPTTAGTGSEVTKGAILHDVARNFKSGIRGDTLYPRLAIVDPDLSEGMPLALARQTAFDSLTHAIESYVCRSASVLTDALAERSIRLFGAHWRQLGQGGAAGRLAHEAMCMTALIGGLNVGNAGTCAPHRLQQALASVGRVSLSHPEGLAGVYPFWIEAARPHAPERFQDIACWLRLRVDDLPQAIAGIVSELGMAPSLAAWGYREDDVPTVLRCLSGNLGNDPIDGLDAGGVGRLFLQAVR